MPRTMEVTVGRALSVKRKKAQKHPSQVSLLQACVWPGGMAAVRELCPRAARPGDSGGSPFPWVPIARSDRALPLLCEIPYSFDVR